jgi:twitching motility protein PilT
METQVALVESLISALIRSNGDALVLHIGERPYVVASAGPIELSTNALTDHAIIGMIQQLLPPEALKTLEEFGAVEHPLSLTDTVRGDRFTLVAARGEGDVWMDIRRQRVVEEPEAAVTESGPASATPASVIPMSRPLRADQPQTSPARPIYAQGAIERLLTVAVQRGATTVYLVSEATPFVRVDGDVRTLDGAPRQSPDDIEAGLAEFVPDGMRDAWGRGEPAEWVADVGGIGRVRCSTFRDHRGHGAIFQVLHERPMAVRQLGLTPATESLATESEGLVLLASPRQQGKTTLAAGFVDLINYTRPSYVVTVERAVRLVHEPLKSLISQREGRATTDQTLAMLHGVLAERPDVLVIDDYETADIWRLALDAAGAGVLVLATVNAGSATAALQRVIALFPEDQRQRTHSLLAERLRGVVAQVLMRRTTGGRAAARELLLVTSAVRRVIEEGPLSDLPLAIERGRKHGQLPLNESLLELVRSSAVDMREAYRKADDREGLVLAFKRESIDPSMVERLA